MNLPPSELSAALEKCILLLQSFLPCLLSVLSDKRSVWKNWEGRRENWVWILLVCRRW